MTHNKGKKYKKCPICKRKRYCTAKSVGNRHIEATCSKGHKWVFRLPTLKDIMNELDKVAKSIPNLFDRDDVFYKSVRRNK